jgi:hypothetical protein
LTLLAQAWYLSSESRSKSKNNLKAFSRSCGSFSKLSSLKHDSLKKRISLSTTFGKRYKYYFPQEKFKIHIMHKRL